MHHLLSFILETVPRSDFHYCDVRGYVCAEYALQHAADQDRFIAYRLHNCLRHVGLILTYCADVDSPQLSRALLRLHVAVSEECSKRRRDETSREVEPRMVPADEKNFSRSRIWSAALLW